MISIRSRFKIAANIPVRRKAAVTSDSKAENIKCEPEEKIDEQPEIVKLDDATVPHENKKGAPDNANLVTVAKIQDKPNRFKPNRAPVHIPVRRKVLINEKLSSKDSEASDTESKKYDVSTNKNDVRNESQSEDERPKTPPSVLLSPAVLKSPSRGRFARPSFIEAASRRHSVHASSASESEDESRRIKNASKARKLSESNSVIESQTSIVQSPDKNSEGSRSVECARLALMPKRKRPTVSNFVRKIAEARRDFKKKFAREKPERSKLTMFDLIFYNPASKKMNENSESKEESKHKIASNVIQEERLQEEDVDDPTNENEDEAEPAVPVPQVKIGDNGEIILDEKSLVIETTEAKKGREALMNSVPVFEDKNRRVSYFGKKRVRTKEWTPIETKCFYKALNSLGTDFAMMQSLFPDRTRTDLKNKFKREDRVNSHLIDIALMKPSKFNIELLKKELDYERTLVEEETKRQIEEKAKAELRRKENEALRRESSKSDQDCVTILKKFIEADGDSKPRILRRGPQRRKLCTDFVDPFEVGDDGLSDFKKPRMVNQCKDQKTSKTTQVIAASKGKNRQTSRMGRPRKCKEENEESIVYYPDEQHFSDNDSICSINENERTEEIGNLEFAQLINRNIKNLTQTTIRILAPSPSNEDCNVRVVVDVSDCNSIDDFSQPVIFDQRLNDRSPLLKVEGKLYDDNISGEPVNSDTKFKKNTTNSKTTINQNDFEVVVDNLNVLSDCSDSGEPISDDSIKISNSRSYISKFKTHGKDLFMKKENNINFSLKSESDDVSSECHTVYASEENETSTAEGKANETPNLFEGPILVDSESEEIGVSNESSTINLPELSNTEESEAPAPEINDDVTIISADDCVKKRTSGGFQYTLIKSGTSSADKKTYLAGLTPGSFVFMTTETSAPLEQRCSMYMISESVSADGVKDFVPVPVFLPPELMKLITDEMR